MTTTPSFSCLFSPPLSPPSTTRLQASPLTTLATSTPLGAITVLASVVLVHEAGHYLAARSFNISVDEFSVGFGPKLLGFSALGNEFNLRGLPLGGYVKFPENYNITLVEQQERAAERAFQQRREQEQWTITQEILNLATFGQWDERRRVKKKRERMLAMEGQAPPNWLQNVLFFRRKPVAAQEEEIDPEDFEIEYYEDPNLLQNRPWIQRAIVLVGGVVFNMILAYTIYFGEIRFGNGLPKPVFDNGVVVSQSPNANAPAYSKLQQGDVIVGINGTYHLTFTTLRGLLLVFVFWFLVESVSHLSVRLGDNHRILHRQSDRLGWNRGYRRTETSHRCYHRHSSNALGR